MFVLRYLPQLNSGGSEPRNQQASYNASPFFSTICIHERDADGVKQHEYKHYTNDCEDRGKVLVNVLCRMDKVNCVNQRQYFDCC